MLVDENSRELVIKVAHNLNSKIKPGTRVPIGEGIAGWVVREARPIVLVDGVGSDQNLMHQKKVRNAVSLPILLDRRVVGVLNLSYDHDLENRRFSPTELSFLTTLANNAAAAINNAQLFEELRTNYFRTIEALATAIEAKDPYTHGHSTRVADYAIATARQLNMTDEEIETMQTAAYLHDVGKIGIPEPILTKPGKLTKEEFEIIKTHPEISARILAPVNFHGEVISIVRHHHERVDGLGYPDRIEGGLIPVQARILSVADAFDAMTSVRPYRPAITSDDAKAELLRCAGTQFDQKIVEAFLKTLQAQKLGDAQSRTADPIFSKLKIGS
jgi:putative nucleotidyltransferase with HDIG domain